MGPAPSVDPPHPFVDHKDRVRHHAHRQNLQHITQEFSSFNRESKASKSGFREVYICNEKFGVKWHNKKQGQHEMAAEAAAHWNWLARKHFGDMLDEVTGILNEGVDNVEFGIQERKTRQSPGEGCKQWF